MRNMIQWTIRDTKIVMQPSFWYGYDSRYFFFFFLQKRQRSSSKEGTKIFYRSIWRAGSFFKISIYFRRKVSHIFLLNSVEWKLFSFQEARVFLIPIPRKIESLFLRNSSFISDDTQIFCHKMNHRFIV